jgi:integrase/recombinase XerD
MDTTGAPADNTAAGPAPPTRLIWPLAWWPAEDRMLWQRARQGQGPEGRDNPAAGWRARTAAKYAGGYGRYLSWLARSGLLLEAESGPARITPQRVADYTAMLKASVAPVSVGILLGALVAVARSLAPQRDWRWLSRRYTRLKLRARPSRDKRAALRHTEELYAFGKQTMDTAREAAGESIMPALRYQAGLMIALLAARPLRIRNFQAIALGTTLRWDSRGYSLTFDGGDTKTGETINEPLPDDLVGYLEAFLQIWRPVLLKQAAKFGGDPGHCRLWVDRQGQPMAEFTLRETIKRYTRSAFGTALWPHLFRDCLLTSLANDQPELMRIGATLLGHRSDATGEKHYNQAGMLDAGRRYAGTIAKLRRGYLRDLKAGRGRKI